MCVSACVWSVVSNETGSALVIYVPLALKCRHVSDFMFLATLREIPPVCSGWGGKFGRRWTTDGSPNSSFGWFQLYNKTGCDISGWDRVTAWEKISMDKHSTWSCSWDGNKLQLQILKAAENTHLNINNKWLVRKVRPHSQSHPGGNTTALCPALFTLAGDCRWLFIFINLNVDDENLKHQFEKFYTKANLNTNILKVRQRENIPFYNHSVLSAVAFLWLQHVACSTCMCLFACRVGEWDPTRSLIN